jgi:hypothetical protein
MVTGIFNVRFVSAQFMKSESLNLWMIGLLSVVEESLGQRLRLQVQSVSAQ